MQDSLSTGVFLTVPPGFSIRRAKRKRLLDEELENQPVWEQAFNGMWNSIEKEFQARYDNSFNAVQNEQIRNLIKCYNNTDAKSLIRCDLLLAGANVPDRNLVLNQLKTALVNELSPHIAILWASQCSSTKVAAKHFFGQIIKSDKAIDLHSDEEDDNTTSTSNDAVNLKIAKKNYSMTILEKWYNVVERGKKSTKPPIIMMIADFESFEPGVVNHLIELIGSYNLQIPFLIIIGVSTSSSMVYQTLYPHVISQLSFREIQYESPANLLNRIINEVLFNDKYLFRLDGEIMSLLVDHFVLNTFSVKIFMSEFKYCMLEHFHDKNHISLCCPPSVLAENLKALSHDDLEQIRRIPSFQKHVEKSPLEERKLLLLNDDHLKVFIEEKLSLINLYLSDFHVILKCLQICTCDLPGAPLGKHLRDLYCLSISSPLQKDEDYKKCLKLIQMQSRQEILTKIVQTIDLLKIDSIVDILETGSEQFDSAIEALEKLLADFKHLEKLEISKVNNAKPSVSYEDLRSAYVQFIDKDLVGKFLKPLTAFTLHEIVLFSDMAGVKKRLVGNARGSTHSALINPQRYLECDCCCLEEIDNILGSMPDVCVAYKSHLECGKIIHLTDWLHSFAAIIQPEKGELDQQIRARFTRAVSELQFLGYIKASKGKNTKVYKQNFAAF